MIGSEDERVNQDVGTPREGPRTEATPRPWFWNSYSAIYGGPAIIVDGEPEYAQVVPLPKPTRGDITTAQGEADARLIVEAVNAYDRLRGIEAAAENWALVSGHLDYYGATELAAAEEALAASLRDKEIAK